MPIRPNETSETHARAPQFMNGAAYMTLVLGYLMGIMLADHLTLGAFRRLPGCSFSMPPGWCC